VRPAGETRRQSLTSENLGALGALAVRKLTQILILERGVRITRVQPRNQSDDLHTESAGLWRPRPGLVRLVHRPLEHEDVATLAEVARSQALGEAVLVEGSAGEGDLVDDPAVQVIRAEALVERIRSSALIEWRDGRPLPAEGRFELASNLNQIAPALDPVGLRWLPTLSFNQVPRELEGSGSAEDLFERISFRVLTSTLRLGGRRLGTRRRGERVPDAVIRWGDGAAILDCKAAQYGYRMDIDDQRALVEYFGHHAEEERDAGFELQFIVVVSGDFEGEYDRTHPFHGRARTIESESGARLVYLRASDLVRLAVEVESDAADPTKREQIPWSTLFSGGLLDTDTVLAAWRNL
jgi:hypothetical protein